MLLPPMASAGKSHAPHRRVDTGFILGKKSGAINGIFIGYYQNTWEFKSNY